MDLPFPFRGFLLGLSIAAVLGPIGLLCVRRTLASGFIVGFASGLGAATADASYAAIAGFGVTAVAAMLVDQRSGYAWWAAFSWSIWVCRPCAPCLRSGRRNRARRAWLAPTRRRSRSR